MRAQSTTKPLPGSRDLQHLLGSITPVLSPTRYTYCTVPLDEGDPVMESQAVATFLEVEGKTLVVEFEAAVTAGLEAVGEWAMLTMKVHSSLDAVGFYRGDRIGLGGAAHKRQRDVRLFSRPRVCAMVEATRRNRGARGAHCQISVSPRSIGRVVDRTV